MDPRLIFLIKGVCIMSELETKCIHGSADFTYLTSVLP